MSKLHIALVRQKYNAAGGAERFVSRAIQALANDGAQITLLTRKWENLQGMQAIRLNPFYLGNVWRDAGFARAVCQAQKTQRFDLVQSHERLACCDVYRAGDGVHREWLAQRRRVLSPLGKLSLLLNPYHHYVQAAETRMFHSPRLKTVICNSKMVKAEIQHYFGLPDERFEIIYNGIDTDSFHPGLRQQHRAQMRQQLGLTPDQPVFLYVGSGFERKGVAPALQALALVPEATLVIVGHDKKAARYQQLARALGIAERTRFVGAQKDVKAYYGMADALLLPTLYDPFPNVVVEAMGCGLPVITSNKCGAAELIDDGQQGFVRDALDIAGLAQAIRRLCDSETARNMGVAARQLAEPLRLDRMAQQLNALYRKLLQLPE